MNHVNIGPSSALSSPLHNPLAHGMQLGRQLRCAGNTWHAFSPATSGFQLGVGSSSASSHAMNMAVQQAHASMIDQVREHMAPSSADSVDGGLRLIDGAQGNAMEAIFRHAADPAQAKEIYMKGNYGARMGVEDLAVVLSEIRMQGGAGEDCTKLEKSLCKMLVEDGLDDHSGFSAWHEGNCYEKVQELTAKINDKFNALPEGSDIFEAAMKREVMPAIRNYLEGQFGHLSYETWEKINSASGLISRSAAEAAERMTQSLHHQDLSGGTSELRAKANQWRVAQHWAELMRSTYNAPEAARRTGATPAAPEPASAHEPAEAEAPAPCSIKQEANPVFNPVIVIGARDADATAIRILDGKEAATPVTQLADDLPRPASQGEARATVDTVVHKSPVVVRAAPADSPESARPEHMPGQIRVEDEVDGNKRLDGTPEPPAEDVPDARQMPGASGVTFASVLDSAGFEQARQEVVQAPRLQTPVPPPLPQPVVSPLPPPALPVSHATPQASPELEIPAMSPLDEKAAGDTVTFSISQSQKLSTASRPIQVGPAYSR